MYLAWFKSALCEFRELESPADCPEAIKALIVQCLEAKADDRPNIKEVFDILKANQISNSCESSQELRKTSASSLSQELRVLKRRSGHS